MTHSAGEFSRRLCRFLDFLCMLKHSSVPVLVRVIWTWNCASLQQCCLVASSSCSCRRRLSPVGTEQVTMVFNCIKDHEPRWSRLLVLFLTFFFPLFASLSAFLEFQHCWFRWLILLPWPVSFMVLIRSYECSEHLAILRRHIYIYTVYTLYNYIP